MKKRVRTQPTNPYYSNEPAIPISGMADKAMVPAPIASKTPKMVDKHPAKLSGLADFTSRSKPPKGNAHISSPKLGTTAKQPAQAGKLRMSGHSGAHRIGGIKKLKGI